MRTHIRWLKVLGAACLVALLAVDGLTLTETAVAQRRGGRGGGFRGGGAHRMHSGGSRYHGSTRARSSGSVRHGYSGRSSRSGSAHRRAGSRSSGAHRQPGRRAGSPGRTPRSRAAIDRTPSYGSLTGRGDATRSLAERNRGRPGDGARSLRDVSRRDPAQRPPGWEDRRDQRWDRRQERREELSDGAIWYPWGGYGYWWDDGSWWDPYYYGDDVAYVEVYPPEPVELDDLPEGAREITTDDGDTLYEYNGVYYRKTDGGYVVVPAPGAGDDLDPVTIVRRACDFIMQQAAISLTVTDTMDHVQGSGQKILTHARRTIRISRPSRFATVAQGDDLDRSLWFDGETITLVDRLENIHAQTRGPRTNDDMLDFLVRQLSVSVPLIDWLYSDPYAALSDALENGEYLGLMDVDGASCHHLSFSLDDADWQLWVDAGERPVPRRLAITYTSVPEHPTYTAQIESLESSPRFDDETFRAVIPDGTKQIAFAPRGAEADRLRDELEQLRNDNRRIDDYIASTSTISLYSQIAHKPEAAARIAAEEKRLEEIGEVSQDEVDAYLAKKKELRARLDKARRAARGA